jgi:hypothetical protein
VEIHILVRGVKIRISGDSYTSKGGGDSSTVNKFVYCQTHFQGHMHCSEHPPVYEMGQKRRFIYYNTFVYYTLNLVYDLSYGNWCT